MAGNPASPVVGEKKSLYRVPRQPTVAGRDAEIAHLFHGHDEIVQAAKDLSAGGTSGTCHGPDPAPWFERTMKGSRRSARSEVCPGFIWESMTG
jgi:hypothetical protein